MTWASVVAFRNFLGCEGKERLCPSSHYKGLHEDRGPGEKVITHEWSCLKFMFNPVRYPEYTSP